MSELVRYPIPATVQQSFVFDADQTQRGSPFHNGVRRRSHAVARLGNDSGEHLDDRCSSSLFSTCCSIREAA